MGNAFGSAGGPDTVDVAEIDRHERDPDHFPSELQPYVLAVASAAKFKIFCA